MLMYEDSKTTRQARREDCEGRQRLEKGEKVLIKNKRIKGVRNNFSYPFYLCRTHQMQYF